MLRYHCALFQEVGSVNHHMHAHFRATVVPPRMEFVIHDHTTWTTWSLGIQAFNFQARNSLRTLRPSEAWVMHCGVNCRGEFHAIQPMEGPTALGMSFALDVEVSWHAAFANIAGRSGNRYILLSMRPVEGTAVWDRSTRGPIRAIRLIDAPEAPSNHEAVAAEQSPTNPVEVESPAITPPSPAHQPTGDTAAISREVAISEEVPIGQAWSTPPLFDIPFSSVSGAPNITRPTSPPIALHDVDPFGLSEFDSGMAMVREINQQRVGHQVDDRLARLGLPTTNIAPDLGLPDVQSNEIAERIPAPPATPKLIHPPAHANRHPRFRGDLPMISRHPDHSENASPHRLNAGRFGVKPAID